MVDNKNIFENKKEDGKFLFGKNKKAQGLSVTTIILIVLGLVVLVVLILGFTMGWSNMKEWIAPSNNVQSVVDACGIACGMDQKYNFCSEKRELKADGNITKDTTCYVLSKKKPEYGIEECGSVACGINDTADKDNIKMNCKGKKVGDKVYYIEDMKVVEDICTALDIQ